MDFIKSLPKSNSFSMLLVVLNLLTKLPHFLPLKHPFTAEGVAAIFSKEIMQSTWYSKKHYQRQGQGLIH